MNLLMRELINIFQCKSSKIMQSIIEVETVYFKSLFKVLNTVQLNNL